MQMFSTSEKSFCILTFILLEKEQWRRGDSRPLFFLFKGALPFLYNLSLSIVVKVLITSFSTCLWGFEAVPSDRCWQSRRPSHFWSKMNQPHLNTLKKFTQVCCSLVFWITCTTVQIPKKSTSCYMGSHWCFLNSLCQQNRKKLNLCLWIYSMLLIGWVLCVFHRKSYYFSVCLWVKLRRAPTS